MNRYLFLLPLSLFSISIAYAEPLDSVHTAVLNHNGDSADVQITWNHDQKVAKYEVGCVSCIPNTIEFTHKNTISLNKITSIPNSSLAILYAIAYDLENEIVAAKQIIVDLKP